MSGSCNFRIDKGRKKRQTREAKGGEERGMKRREEKHDSIEN